MKALKALVAGMGVLIVIGIGLVGYGVMRGKPKAEPMTAEHMTILSLEPFDTRLPVPRGSKLEQMTNAGDRIVLRFAGPDGDKLIVVDSRTGQPAGTITLVP